MIDVIESEEEFALLDQQIIELDAIEIGFVDDYQNPVDVDFTWQIDEFTEDQLKIKFYFDDVSKVSENFEYDDRVTVTFWDTENLRYTDGDEIPFGSKMQWLTIR